MHISLLRITVIIKRYVININNANSEVRKSLDESVVIINEIGYFYMSKKDANHLTKCHNVNFMNESSTILTSNLIFSQKKKIFLNNLS